MAVLAHALAVIRNEKFGGHADAGAVAVAALYHDASEILTGDMLRPSSMTTLPSAKPTRRWKRWRRKSCCICCRRNFSRCTPHPHGDGPGDGAAGEGGGQAVRYIKCVEELKAGNSEFRDAAAQTRAALEEYELPEVTYFLETFMPSFSLTLDQLK